MHPLIEEAMKKAAVAWLSVPGVAVEERPDTVRTFPVWCQWIGDCLYVVSGPGEQPAPGLAGARSATVAARGDHGGRIVTWPATVTRVDPQDPGWEGLAAHLAGKRLNTPGPVADTVTRWARQCVVTRLTPAGDPVDT